MYIFGAGMILERLYDSAKICWDEVEAVLDNSSELWGEKIHGKEIRNPAVLLNEKSSTIVVASSKYFSEIVYQLKHDLHVEAINIRSWFWYIGAPQLEIGYRMSSRHTEETTKKIIADLSAKYLLDATNIFSNRGVVSINRKLTNDFVVDSLTLRQTPADELLSANVYRNIFNDYRSLVDYSYDCVLFVDAYFSMSLSECKEALRYTYDCSRYVVVNLPICPQSYIAEDWHGADFSGFGKVTVITTMYYGTFIVIEKNVQPARTMGLYVVTHKKISLENDLSMGYRIIFAGADGHDDCYGYLRDDVGKNISFLNGKINECTAMYWLWKHAEDSYIGMCHYRRFFLSEDDAEPEMKNILKPAQALEYFREYDIILLEPPDIGCVEKQMVDFVSEAAARDGIEIFREALTRIHPKSITAYDWVMHSSAFWGCNMFIMRRRDFNDYCEWLFSFLIDAAKVFDVNGFDSYSQRIIGFLAERMLTVWLLDKKLKIKTLPMLLVKETV